MTETQPVPDGPAPIAGRLEGIGVPDLLRTLCRRRQTGVLTFDWPGVRKRVFLADGRIVFASSTDPDDRLGTQLLRAEEVRLEDLEVAVRRLHTGKRLGTLLVEAGSLTPDELVRGVLTQVESIVLDLFLHVAGQYHFEPGPLPSDEVITLEMKTGVLLLRGVRRVRSFARVRDSVGSPRTRYRLADDWTTALEGLSLSESEELLIERLRHGAERVDVLCREVFLSNFEIYQALWGLRVLGVIGEVGRAESPLVSAHEGRLEDDGLPELLMRFAATGETGVLLVARGAQERAFHLERGRCVFATSEDLEDGLVAFLLRRGVISMEQRAEASRRLLSNKRIGTILRELGVLDERDLSEMVRQQLAEIVLDTFDWNDGDYEFVPGPLPTREEITLDAPVEALVQAGLRRIRSWSRHRKGCGGLDSRLVLGPCYLDVLDRLGAGSEEWRIVTALRDGATPRQLCRELDLGDFHVCRILWTLRLLGAVEIAPAEELEDAPPLDIVVPPAAEPPVASTPEPLDTTPGPPEAGEEPVPSVEPPRPGETTDSLDEVPSVPPSHERSVAPLAASTTEAPPPDEARPQTEAEPDAAWLDASPDPVDVPATDEEGLAADGDVERLDASLDTTEAPAEAAPLDASPDPVDVPATDEEGLAARAEEERPDASLDTTEAPATGEESSAEGAPAPGPRWQPPLDLERIIDGFNAAQRIVFRAVRTEVGAGAANFIRAACTDGSGEADLLGDAELLPDGSWDREGLERAVRDRRVGDPGPLYRALIERELEALGEHIGAARVLEVRRQVDRLGPRL